MKFKITSKEPVWLVLEPYTYIHFNNRSEVIIYNELNNAKIISYNIIVIEYLKLLNEEINLRVILINKKDLTDIQLINFLQEALDYFMIDIVPISYSKKKPIQIPDKLNLQGIKRKKRDDIIIKDVLFNLTEIFFLFGVVDLSENEYAVRYTSQIPYYYNKGCDIHFNFFELKNFISSIKESSVFKIHIIGHDFIQDSKYEQSLEYFLRRNYLIEFYINANFLDEKLCNIISKLAIDSKIKFNLIIDIDTNNKKFCSTIINHASLFNYKFMVTNEGDLCKYNALIEYLHFENYDFVPVFTGKNKSFFEKHVYLNYDDLLDISPSILELKKNEFLNSNYFGKIFLTHNKLFSTSINTEKWVKFNILKIIPIIENEFTHNRNWFLIRDKAPCSECVFQWFCPSPSNYELAIGKPNLCHIKP